MRTGETGKRPFGANRAALNLSEGQVWFVTYGGMQENGVMTDRLTGKERSWNMSRIRSRNTRPEIIARSILHCLGYRFRLHRNDLPGSPDIVLPKYRTVIFAHGCFWHRHKNCRYAYNPKSRTGFWRKKFRENVERDKRTRLALRRSGWKVIVVWECELNKPDNLIMRFKREINRRTGRTAR